MALNFGRFWSSLFGTSEIDNLGIGAKGKESFWSCSGYNFKAGNSGDGYDYENAIEGAFHPQDAQIAIANVTIPDGAVITAAVVYGNDAVETWTLHRIKISDGTNAVLGSGNLNSEDTTISSETINNSLFSYAIVTSTLDNVDLIYGARVTFTT